MSISLFYQPIYFSVFSDVRSRSQLFVWYAQWNYFVSCADIHLGSLHKYLLARFLQMCKRKSKFKKRKKSSINKTDYSLCRCHVDKAGWKYVMEQNHKNVLFLERFGMKKFIILFINRQFIHIPQRQVANLVGINSAVRSELFKKLWNFI